MSKTLLARFKNNLNLTHIFLIPLLISLPLESLKADQIQRDPAVVAIANWQVFNSCSASLDQENENR